MSLIILGALTGSTEIPSVFVGLLCSLNDNTARLQEGHRTETRATATCLTGRFLCLWRKLWTFAGRVSCKMSSDGTSSYLSNEQHKPSCVEVFPLRDWIAAVTSRSGSYFMDAKMGSWSACIKLSSIQGWMIYLRRPIFPLLHTLFLWVHPRRPYSSGTIVLESPSKGFYFTWRSLPECCHPLGDICLPVCFEEEQGSISKSEWAAG